MVAFDSGQTITSSKPAILVDGLLAPGIYRFQLIVVDDRNVASAPASLVVHITEQQASGI
jgi:hypothetical protein